MLFCSLRVPSDQLPEVFREELHVCLRSGPEPFHTWQGWFHHHTHTVKHTRCRFCTFDSFIDLQVKCEDQGDLGLAGARHLPLRAPLCSNPRGSRWGWRYLKTHTRIFNLEPAASVTDGVVSFRSAADYRGSPRLPEASLPPHPQCQGPVWGRQGRGGVLDSRHLSRDVQAMSRFHKFMTKSVRSQT